MFERLQIFGADFFCVGLISAVTKEKRTLLVTKPKSKIDWHVFNLNKRGAAEPTPAPKPRVTVARVAA
jgi:hypothetical protein